MSWNVAGWKNTVNNIHQHHKPKPGASSDASVENWLQELNVDILCLQEVKLSKEKIIESAVSYGFRGDKYDVFFCTPAGSETNKNSKSTSRQQGGGLNGVASFVRKGLTLRACNTALDNGGGLDKEGRCIMTDHGKFVVFNVYVPNGQGGARMPLKQAFLAALDRAMVKQRKNGKKVILCGDLNIHYRPQDCFKYWRRIDVNAMCYHREDYHTRFMGFDAIPSSNSSRGEKSYSGLTEEKLQAFLDYIASEWKPIEASLNHTITTTVTRSDKGGGGPAGNGGGGVKGASKGSIEVTVRMKAQHPTTKEDVVLMTKKPKIKESEADTEKGLREGTADTVSRMKWSFHLKGRFVDREGVSISEEDYNRALMSTTTNNTTTATTISSSGNSGGDEKGVLQVKPSGCLDVEDLRRVLSTLNTTYFDPVTAFVLPNKPKDYKATEYEMRMKPYWDAIADRFGDAAASPCDIHWMRSQLARTISTPNPNSTGGTMVDPFALARGYTQDRFTIWSQYTNERYRNEGTRIDFTLCDVELWNEYGRRGGELEGFQHPQAPPGSLTQTNQGKAAHDAATNFNCFQPAPMDGSGMANAPEYAYQSHLRGHLKDTGTDFVQGSGNLHTGIIYTPPEYSDHVAVSLVLDDAIRETAPLIVAGDRETKATQPHMAQKTLKSFFGVPASKSSNGNSNSISSSSLGSGNTGSGGSSNSRKTTTNMTAKGAKRSASASTMTTFFAGQKKPKETVK